MSLTSFLSLHPKKHLIFDFDATIAKLDVDWGKMLQEIYDRLSEIDPKTMIAYTPRSMSYPFWNTLIKKDGLSMKKLIESHFIKAEGIGLKEVIPNPPLIDFIKNHGEYMYYIWSNNLRTTIDPILEKEGIKDTFKWVVSPSDNLFYKPDTSSIEKRITGDKKDWLMIGDGENDKLAATAVSIDFFLVDFFKK